MKKSELMLELIELVRPFVGSGTKDFLERVLADLKKPVAERSGLLENLFSIGRDDRDQRQGLEAEVISGIQSYQQRNSKLPQYELRALDRIPKELKKLVQKIERAGD
jgi:hypothetical protein